MFRQTILCIALSLLQIGCSRGVEVAYLFDCGPEGSLLKSGYSRLTESNLYNPRSGYGWRGLEYKKGIDRNLGFDGLPGIFPDSLSVDWVGGARELAIDLANGNYFVCLVSQDPGDTYFLPRHQHKELRIEGETVLQKDFSEAAFYRDNPPFDDSTTRDPAEFYDRYVASRFPIHRFLITVNDKQLNLEFSGENPYAFPVNYLAVLSVSNPKAGQAWVEDQEKYRRENFIKKFGDLIEQGLFHRVMLPTAKEVESGVQSELDSLRRAREERQAGLRRLAASGTRRELQGHIESKRRDLSRLLGPVADDRVVAVENPSAVGSGLYTTEVTVLRTELGKSLKLRASRPRGSSGRLPTALFIPGAGERIDSDDESRLNVLRDSSRLVIEVELPSLASLGGATSEQSAMGVMLSELNLVLDYLLDRPDVSAEQLGLAGYDGGGLVTVMAAALDTRIKVAIAAGAIADLETLIRRDRLPYHNNAIGLPGILREMAMGDILACIPPRPLLILAGRYDEVFPMESLTGIWDSMAPVYEHYGATERVLMWPFDAAHELAGEMIDSTNSWFGIWLEPSRIIEVPGPSSNLERIKRGDS
ncbi:alpha/beta hydrolase family protein [candidate division KSB1 bacterium]